jgi:hypothetical protein
MGRRDGRLKSFDLCSAYDGFACAQDPSRWIQRPRLHYARRRNQARQAIGELWQFCR